MIDTLLLLLAFGLLVLRIMIFVRFWKAPFAYGQDRFFGLPLAAGGERPLLRRYRAWLFAPTIPEAGSLAVVLYWGSALHLIAEQCAVIVLVRIFYSFVAVHFIEQAKALAMRDSWKPVSSVALSLKSRRLVDYTSAAVETFVAVATAASIILLVYHYLGRYSPIETTDGGWQSRHDFREFELPVLLIYLQLGGLLVKHGLVKWRMWLPGERTEEYLMWREAVLRYLLWVCDYGRMLVTGLLLFDAVMVSSRGTSATHWAKAIGIVLLTGVAIAGVPALIRLHSRMTALFLELKPLDAFTRPPQPIQATKQFLGGLLHYDRENPALFVPGPLVLALNLANRRAYLYLAYLTGLGLLVLWAGGITWS